MDRKCSHCNMTTDDGHGYCLHCKTPFPPLKSAKAGHHEEEAEQDAPVKQPAKHK